MGRPKAKLVAVAAATNATLDVMCIDVVSGQRRLEGGLLHAIVA